MDSRQLSLLIVTGSSTLDPADDSLGFCFNPNPASILFQSLFASDDTPIVSSNTPLHTLDLEIRSW